jgi:hypothetical protein
MVAQCYLERRCNLGHPRPRADKRIDSPAYPVEEVVALARGWFILVTGTASRKAARYFGDEKIPVRDLIRDVLLELSREDWSFRQHDEHGWVDVYRVEVFDDWPPAWIKVKIERINGYQGVAVISFHEYDDD